MLRGQRSNLVKALRMAGHDQYSRNAHNRHTLRKPQSLLGTRFCSENVVASSHS